MSEAEDEIGDDPLAATEASFPCTSILHRRSPEMIFPERTNQVAAHVPTSEAYRLAYRRDADPMPGLANFRRCSKRRRPDFHSSRVSNRYKSIAKNLPERRSLTSNQMPKSSIHEAMNGKMKLPFVNHPRVFPNIYPIDRGGSLEKR